MSPELKPGAPGSKLVTGSTFNAKNFNFKGFRPNFEGRVKGGGEGGGSSTFTPLRV